MAHQMAMNMQQELRKMPGNNKCVDCDAPYPQWATVSYGTFMCLECSGRHRGLGVHISFVRSVTMDSWTDKQIRMMQLGGNDHFRREFAQAGVPKNLTIAQKYNTPQAEAFRNRLQALVDGTTPEPLPLWDPSHNPTPANSGPSRTSDDANGVEALSGETEQDYVARQMRLREEARARMAAKFGSSGMQGIGSGGSVSSSNHSSFNGYGDVTETLGSAFSFLSTTVSSAASSAANLVKEKDLSSKVSSGWSSVQSKLSDPELTTSVKSTASSGWSFLTSTTSSLLKNAQSLVDSSVHHENDNGMFPRTNSNLPQSTSYEGIHGTSSFSQPATSHAEEVPQRAATFPSATPLEPTNDYTPAPSAAPKKVVKKDVDFFGEFGM
ncbi:hypothetical protein THRCLA_05927 [Thraustotheca clavata]|uniref:Arf-GAP domain-containing protein n=1 Tax=Thraustotheca clavata TaxID=74557 RepID=A0A1V9ZR75_9STRA|nr:hypothetical protein THRCLA_05927 [Thraustotheca clavata]